MKYYGLDLETEDPYLRDHGKRKARGSSVVFGTGRVIVTGVYDWQKKKKISFDGDGGDKIISLYKNPDVTLIGANIPYDITWDLFSLGIKPEEVKCDFIDVQIVESLIDEYQKYDLDSLSVKYLHEHKGKEVLEGIAEENRMHGDFREHLGTLWDLDYKQEIRDYVLSDADQPCRIFLEHQLPILEEQGLMKAFRMNMDMIKVVVSMKYYGARFDFWKWRENCGVAGKAYEELKNDYEHKYGEVNINSPKQLAVQFDRLNVPYKMKIGIKGWKVEGRKFLNKTDLFQGDELSKQKRTLKDVFNGVAIEKGRLVLYVAKRYGERTAKQLSDMGYEVSLNPCINKSLFTELQNTNAVVADLVQYKQAKNLVDKFLGDKFGRFIVCHVGDERYTALNDDYTLNEHCYDDGASFRIHGSFNIVGARQTGRMSSSAPNLQQVSSKTLLFAGTEKQIDLAHMCRECFIPEPGEAFFKLDYSAAENRLAAHFAPGKNGEKIRRMYNEDPYLDEHKYVTDVSGLGEQFGAKIGRKYAKNLRFGVSYGMQLPRMMTNFGWTKEFAEDLYDKVSGAAPWLFELMEKVQEIVVKRRYIKTVVGRRVHMRRGHDKDAYAFMNYLIQGSSADVTKNAANNVYKTKSCELLTNMIHDEINGSVPCTDEGAERVMGLQHCMQDSTPEVAVPMISDPELGLNWADTIEYTPEYGDRLEFCKTVMHAISEGREAFFALKAKLKHYDEKDDDMTFTEFCAIMEEDEEEETENEQ